MRFTKTIKNLKKIHVQGNNPLLKEERAVSETAAEKNLILIFSIAVPETAQFPGDIHMPEGITVTIIA